MRIYTPTHTFAHAHKHAHAHANTQTHTRTHTHTHTYIHTHTSPIRSDVEALSLVGVTHEFPREALSFRLDLNAKKR